MGTIIYILCAVILVLVIVKAVFPSKSSQGNGVDFGTQQQNAIDLQQFENHHNQDLHNQSVIDHLNIQEHSHHQTTSESNHTHHTHDHN